MLKGSNRLHLFVHSLITGTTVEVIRQPGYGLAVDRRSINNVDKAGEHHQMCLHHKVT